MNTSEKLKKAREVSDKTQKEVADILGVTKSNIGHYETGRTSPSVEQFKKLADIYCVPVSYLMGYGIRRKD